MRRLSGALFVLACVVLLPSAAQAQATLAGVIRDNTGAVLPGVTVEASSPALIGKVRSAATDGTGQYRITDLPPGSYTVTYSLSGFTTVRRENIIVTGSGVIPINIDLRLGTLEETITVTGETPIVDTQSTRREMVLNSDTINTLPATRSYGALLTTIPGLMTNTGSTSAMATPDMTFFTAHGGRQNEGRMLIDGLPVAAAFNGGGVSSFTYDVANAEEMQVLVSGGLGEAENGGPAINLVPRAGGNTFRGSAFYSGAGEWSAADNIDAALEAVNITRPPTILKLWDVSGSYSGPILRDRLWFFGNVRQYGNYQTIEGVIGNQNAGDATRWDYVADPSIQARTANSRDIFSFRVTGQVSEKNRISVYQEYQHRCSGSTRQTSGSGCRNAKSDWTGLGAGGGFPSSPEAWPGYHDFPYYVTQATWTSPMSNRLLLEAGFSRFHYLWAGFGQAPPDHLDLIPVTEQLAIDDHRANFNYRGIFDPIAYGYADNDANPNNWRASASYVTGSHNLKLGYQGSYQKSLQAREANDTLLRYTFNNRQPVGFGFYIAPRWQINDRTATSALYIQDQWTMGRLTLQGAVRYDRAWSWSPSEDNGTTLTSRFNPAPITFPRTVSVEGYNDITTRFGGAWDVFGTGKTALKVNIGKYLETATNDGNYSINNPAGGTRFVTYVPNRSWQDLNGNRVIDCDIMNFTAQNHSATGGDICGGLVGNSLNFGNSNPNVATVNPDILRGWGVRPYDWQFGASVQQEVLPRVSVEVSYNRRWFGNFFVTDNTATAAEDYQAWNLTVPQHAALPGGGGGAATYYTLTQAAASRPARNHTTFETDYADARTHFWHGVDFSANARLGNGLVIQGGTSTGRGVRNTCELTRQLPELLSVLNVNQRFEGCDIKEPWLTSIRGLVSYTVPKVDVLVSAQMRSLNAANVLPGLVGNTSATNGASLNANVQVPNTVVQQSLGRLPPGGLINGTTSVNLLSPGELYPDERVNQVDMRFAKIIRFGGRRADIGLDLYNLFNANDTTTFDQAFDYNTNGANWLRPTAIVSPRFVRFNVRFDF